MVCKAASQHVSMVSFLMESKLHVMTQNAWSSVCPSEEMIAGALYMASWVAFLREVYLDDLGGLTKGVVC